MDITKREVERANHQEILLNEQSSDLELITKGGRSFKVHRAIVCPLVKAFNESNPYGWLDESKTQFDMTGEETDVVKAVLEYIYTSNYSDAPTDRWYFEAVKTNTKRKPDVEDRLLLNISIYVFAMKYEVSGLPQFAQEKWEKTFHTHDFGSEASKYFPFITSFKLLSDDGHGYERKDATFDRKMRAYVLHYFKYFLDAEQQWPASEKTWFGEQQKIWFGEQFRPKKNEHWF